MQRWSFILLILALSVPSFGDGRLVVVIDPGHGGENGGAPCFDHSSEKELTLPLSQMLEVELTQRGYDVVMTRRRDKYLSLKERGATAIDVGGDIFISIHGNASRHHDQRGFETYVLSSRAIVHDAAVFRAGNKSFHNSMLSHFMASQTIQRSAHLANQVHANLRKMWGPSGDRGVRQESMHVLLGLPMPAILVEVGFVDHPIEGKLLKTKKKRQEIAMALADGVDSFFKKKTK